ncbi:MAG TPA: ABC transporter ATP-binding protein [Thermoprotei archaeon]|nr:ABC transporter ATP-binding protein [Thermoprotei archaeon]
MVSDLTEVIRCEAVTVGFGKKDVLRNVNLSVEEDELVGVVGPNGSGKTTLIRAIAGFLPYKGTIYYDGVPTNKLKRRDIAKFLSVVPQEPPVSTLTVMDFVLLGRYPYLSRWKDEGPADVSAATEALRELGALHLKDRQINTLSGGELQRVMLARGVVQGQRVILMDEPTSHLDLKAQQEIMELARSLAKKRSIVATFHDLTLAGQYSDRIVVLREGMMLAQGKPRDVLTSDMISRVYGVKVIIEYEPVFHVIPVFSDSSGQ